jgi:hypothetical protein
MTLLRRLWRWLTRRRDRYEPVEHEPPVRTRVWGGNVDGDARRMEP